MKAETRTILEGSTSTSPYALRKKPANILSAESAMEQVLDFLEYYDIDVEKMHPDATKIVEAYLKTISESVMRGTLEVSRDKDQKMQITLNLSGGTNSMVFKEMGAKHKIAMDKVKAGENYGRLYALMGSLSGLGAGAIEKLPLRDLTVVEALGTVFLTA